LDNGDFEMVQILNSSTYSGNNNSGNLNCHPLDTCVGSDIILPNNKVPFVDFGRQSGQDQDLNLLVATLINENR
jgi:hypothetical protein